MQGSISIQCEPGKGTAEGKLHLRAVLSGNARGSCGMVTLPWQVAAWLGRALQDPRKWIPLCPCSSNVLRVLLASDRRGEIVIVSVQGHLWFEALCTAPATNADGTGAIVRPAAMLGAHILAHAKRVEELESAKAKTGVVSDQATLFAAGSPMLLTRDPKIIEEAAKRAGLDTEYRGLGTVRFSALNNRPLIPLPSAKQYPAGMSEFEFQMARAKTMPRRQRRALLAKLRQEG